MLFATVAKHLPWGQAFVEFKANFSQCLLGQYHQIQFAQKGPEAQRVKVLVPVHKAVRV